MKKLVLLLALSAGCLKMDPDLDDSTPSTQDADNDGFLNTEDCDDGDASVYPGAPELCDDLDNDCDGSVDDDAVDAALWYADTDGDSFGDPDTGQRACARPAGSVEEAGDCDDDNDDVYPDAEELCDGLDNDCDGDVDDGTGGATLYWADADGDGYGDPDAEEEACEQPPGYTDNDEDCDDSTAEVYPGAEERCDGLDNNCDGDTDGADATDPATWYADGDGDGYGDPGATAAACAQPSGFVDNTSDCDDGDASVSPAATEACNGQDDDCDGDTDEDGADGSSTYYLDSDGDGYGDSAASRLSCAQPSGYTPDRTDCDDSRADVSPGSPELCDGVDNDCRGDVDENDAADAPTWYSDTDGDGYGDPAATSRACSRPTGSVADDTDCDDGEASTYPGAPDACYDGTDADCAGDGDYDCDGDGEDADTYGGDDCDDSDPTINPSATDTLDTLDNDCDGYCDEDYITDGTLTITEIHMDPAAVSDTAGEWFEIYNPNAFDVRICEGWNIEDSGGSSHTITSGLVVAAGSYALLARESDSALNGGVTADYEYSGIGLNNVGEALTLTFDGIIIDEVDFTGWYDLFSPGYSLQLDPDTIDYAMNDLSENWCTGTSTFGKGDRGTPGAINDQCF